jgi:hypothetical protein
MRDGRRGSRTQLRRTNSPDTATEAPPSQVRLTVSYKSRGKIALRCSHRRVEPRTTTVQVDRDRVPLSRSKR